MLLLGVLVTQAQGRISVEGFLGAAVNFDTPLSIQQDNHPTLDFSAHYETRPFQGPLYYALRFSYKRISSTWELQFIHHKLHLSNPTKEIQSFEITHGFNIFSLNRSFPSRFLAWRIGFGLVLAHAESKVRGRAYSGHGGLLDTGYHLTGPALIGGTGKEFPISAHFRLLTEIQLIAARARIPVADGTARAPNIALHILLGIAHYI